MKHLTVADYGSFLSLRDERLVVKKEKEIIAQYPLRRLKSVTIAKNGISFSADVIKACAESGVLFFILDFKSIPVVQVSGVHQHAVTELRKRQFAFVNSLHAATLSANFIYGKIRNQRAVLLYFKKTLKDEKHKTILQEAVTEIEKVSTRVKKIIWQHQPNWRNSLMGYEGKAAAIYWQAIQDTNLLGENFHGRVGRNAPDIANQALNLGYSILMSQIWRAVTFAGLEPYAGFLHTDRAGKPSLVLDLMEEYRPWVVDRTIFTMRWYFQNNKEMNIKIKKEIIRRVNEVFTRKYSFNKKKIKLETLIQRQVYRLGGSIYEKKKYKPFLFRW